MRPKQHLTTIDRLAEIPTFHSEAEEHAFWATHELSEALWDQAEPLRPSELPPPRPATTPVVIHLDEGTLNRVKALARHRRPGYRALVAELVTAHLAAEERRTGSGRAGGEAPICDRVALLRALTGYQGELRWDTTKPDGQPRRCLDTTRARASFGWQATTPFEVGLKATIAWYRAHVVSKAAPEPALSF